jgi:fumarate hydratase subunit alpha
MATPLSYETIREKVKNTCIEANYVLGDDVLDAFRRALADEESSLGKEILSQLIENARIAREQKIPLCQDTGLAVFFVEMGDQVPLAGSEVARKGTSGSRCAIPSPGRIPATIPRRSFTGTWCPENP